MKIGKVKKITDNLVGQDEKVCSCSVKIAELIQKGNENKETLSLDQTLAGLRRKKEDKQEK